MSFFETQKNQKNTKEMSKRLILISLLCLTFVNFVPFVFQKINQIIKSIEPILMKTFFVKLASFFLFYMLFSCTTSQQYYDNQNYSYEPRDRPPIVQEPGKCYAKCLIGDQYDFWDESYPVYLGNSNDNFEYLKEIKLVLEEEKTEWIKRKADKNCLSADPNDCLVWCLVNVPEKIETITIVTDTSSTDNYKWEKFEFNEIVKKGGFTEWKEVVCNYKVTADLNRQIQIALRNEGYDPGLIDNVIGTKTKAALVKFQKNNSLPIGNLNIETLDVLGIDY